jgi:hypothetical protein
LSLSCENVLKHRQTHESKQFEKKTLQKQIN